MKNGLKVDVKRSLATARAAVAALVMALSIIACGNNGNGNGDTSHEDLLAMLNGKLPKPSISLEHGVDYPGLTKEFSSVLADKDKVAELNKHLGLLDIKKTKNAAVIGQDSMGKGMLTLPGLDADAAGKGVDDYYGQLPNDGPLVTLSGNEHDPKVSVNTLTWGFNNAEREELIEQLEAAFGNLSAIGIKRLADLADQELAIDKFGIVKGLKPSVEWYIDFLKGPKENGMHIVYFPPEDIKSMGSIINGARLAIVNDRVPNTPDTWIDGVPPANAGRAAAELSSYDAAQESMMAGMIPQNNR